MCLSFADLGHFMVSFRFILSARYCLYDIFSYEEARAHSATYCRKESIKQINY